MADQPSSRRRFQFRLRTLMIGIALVAVVCWSVVLTIQNRKLIRERDEVLQKQAAAEEDIASMEKILREQGPFAYDAVMNKLKQMR